MYRWNEPKLSKHARQRMRERKIALRDVITVLKHGEYEEREEDIRVRIPQSILDEGADPRLQELVGLIVVLSPDEERVVTVFPRESAGGQTLRFTLGMLLGAQLGTFGGGGENGGGQ
ncbi:DUF4258 domain-containing protein [Lujinxingia vulgaris]|nr:DUF4258 domain-containing protein [Lujinxingia vulgaris]